MKILLFDMDGVLLEPNGYHRALQETVRLISKSMGFNEHVLTNGEIAQFESLGISSEWHSSALCHALLWIESCKENIRLPISTYLNTSDAHKLDTKIDLANLFQVIGDQPNGLPAIKRAQMAIEHIVVQDGIEPETPAGIIKHCESIDHSLTLNVFQELVLGSDIYERTYKRDKQVNEDSYLRQYDKPLLSQKAKENLLSWLQEPAHAAAIITNRPSRQLPQAASTPEAELGAEILGLESLPIIGRGEIYWVAEEMGAEAVTLTKPSPLHTLAAILVASGHGLKNSLLEAYQATNSHGYASWDFLERSTVYVFEDSTAGLISADNMREVLSRKEISITVRKLGITTDPMKRSSLTAQCATVFDSIDDALCSIDGLNHL